MTRHYLPERCWREQGSLVNRPLTPDSTELTDVRPLSRDEARGDGERQSSSCWSDCLPACSWPWPTLYAGDPPQMTAARLKKQVLAAIHTGAVQYEPAQNEITNRRMIVTVASVPDASDSDLQDPLVKVFYDQLELELLRKDLLKRQRSRQIMEPYYAKAERTHR